MYIEKEKNKGARIIRRFRLFHKNVLKLIESDPFPNKMCPINIRRSGWIRGYRAMEWMETTNGGVSPPFFARLYAKMAFIDSRFG